jgi:hypothetical protein
MFCALGHIFGGAECVGSRFHVLRVRSRFPRYRGHQVSFSSFALPDSCSTVHRASGPVFMLCAPGLVVSGTEGVGSCIHVLCSRTRFRRYRGRRLRFSRFARPDSFSAVPWLSGSVIKLCAPRLIFGGIEGVCSRFHVLRARIHFRRYRGHWVPFSCFAHKVIFRGTEGVGSRFNILRAHSFSAVLRVSGPVFMFCAPGVIFGDTESVRCLFHILRSRTHFRRYRGRQVPFSCFALPDSFSAVQRASTPIFMFCVPGLIFDGTDGVGSHFQV